MFLGHLLQDMQTVIPSPTTATPLCFVDTAGSHLYETSAGVSKGNQGSITYQEPKVNILR